MEYSRLSIFSMQNSGACNQYSSEKNGIHICNVPDASNPASIPLPIELSVQYFSTSYAREVATTVNGILSFGWFPTLTMSVHLLCKERMHTLHFMKIWPYRP